ncbi:tetratricopeptide repeat protein [Thermogutta sp.]|uniref:tetratricopeptide repeat protein n=1 Tax=Thermogutta sp. TaxID=1962930 RepID=UPI00321F6E20
MNTWDCPADKATITNGVAQAVRSTSRGLLLSILVLFLPGAFLLVAGCRSMLELPDRAKRSGYDPQQPAEEGWLFRNLMGEKDQPATTSQSSGAAPSAASHGQSTGQVEQEDAQPTGTVGSSAQHTSAAELTGEPLPPADADTVIVPRSDEENEEEEDFILFEIPKRLGKLFQPKRDESLARALFQEGAELYRRGRYEEAAAKFKKAAKHWPNSPLEEDALFMAGESYFFADRYPQAENAYLELLKKYEFTRYLDTVSKREFAIGRYWEQVELSRPSMLGLVQWGDKSRPTFDTWGRAIKAYQNVRLYDPTGPLADDAVMATANAYFLKGRYEDAAYHYDLLRKDYSQSEHAVNAAFLAIKAHDLSYQGPLYDGTPLEKAERAADELLTVYRDRLGSEKEQVLRAKNEITEEKAMRYFAIGQYYDNRHYYGAARYYYRATLREFPHTKAAVLAAERIRQIDGLPDKPPNRFKFLTDLFESAKEES